jgi:hypothetical protein
MCRDELILKQTAVGLVTLDSKPEDASALLACFEGAVLSVYASSLHRDCHNDAAVFNTPAANWSRPKHPSPPRHRNTAAQPNVDTARMEAFLQQMVETAPRKPV